MSEPSPDPSAVIKLGGSLLDLPDLPVRLTNFLADFGRPHPIVLCGGGQSVDLIRKWDRLFNLGEEPSHWLALQALTVNSQVLAHAVPGLAYVTAISDFGRVWAAGETPVYDAYRFILDADEQRSGSLPRRWRVTSDSIAARAASHLNAAEVVLLKSVTLPPRVSFEEAAREGWVDPHFPVVAREVERVTSVNFREDAPPETVFFPEPST